MNAQKVLVSAKVGNGSTDFDEMLCVELGRSSRDQRLPDHAGEAGVGSLSNNKY